MKVNLFSTIRIHVKINKIQPKLQAQYFLHLGSVSPSNHISKRHWTNKKTSFVIWSLAFARLQHVMPTNCRGMKIWTLRLLNGTQISGVWYQIVSTWTQPKKNFIFRPVRTVATLSFAPSIAVPARKGLHPRRHGKEEEEEGGDRRRSRPPPR